MTETRRTVNSSSLCEGDAPRRKVTTVQTEKGLRMKALLCSERATGIEPVSKAWEAFVLPLNYARNADGFYLKCKGPFVGGPCAISSRWDCAISPQGESIRSQANALSVFFSARPQHWGLPRFSSASRYCHRRFDRGTPDRRLDPRTAQAVVRPRPVRDLPCWPSEPGRPAGTNRRQEFLRRR